MIMLSRLWPGYSRTGIATGWLLAVIYVIHAGLTTALARTDRASPLREELRGWHYVMGTLLFLTALVRLRAWLAERPAPPPGLPASAFAWGKALAFVPLLLMILAPLFGLLYAWSDDLPVRLGPVTLPALVGRDRALWQATGYFHSGLGFMLVVLNLATLVTAALTSLRFRHGLLSAFPPGHGAFAFFGFSATVYAFATFRSPNPGPIAVAIFWALAAGWAVLAWAIHGNRPLVPRSRAVSPLARTLAATGALALLGFGAWGPYGLFRVTPFAAPADVAAVGGIEWHETPALARLEIRPADEFEAAVEAETFKWCTFCHNMQPGSTQHKVGPNLYNIMGQRAGTVPGFGYSEAMRKARDDGLIWTDETVAAYIADPQRWMPGTSMVVSSGPIPDPKVQAAVVNLLKRATAPRD